MFDITGDENSSTFVHPRMSLTERLIRRMITHKRFVNGWTATNNPQVSGYSGRYRMPQCGGGTGLCAIAYYHQEIVGQIHRLVASTEYIHTFAHIRANFRYTSSAMLADVKVKGDLNLARHPEATCGPGNTRL